MKRDVIVVCCMIMSCLAICCTRKYVESFVGSEGAVIELDGGRFEIPAGSVPDSTRVRIERKRYAERSFDQGYTLVGESFIIMPETLVFARPIRFSYSVGNENAGIGAKISTGFVPVAGAAVQAVTLEAQLWHGGEYCLIREPERYGIVEHEATAEGLLIVTDLYVGDYATDLRKNLRKHGYTLPVWTFVCDKSRTIEDNARLLADELRARHEDYGDFRLDVVSFGVGGLVTHRYLTDSAYYQRDISPAVIAIGTPFFGSSFADIGNAKRATSPFRFFFIDGMAEHAVDLDPQSEFVTLIRENRMPVGGHYYDEPQENKNFASIRGTSTFGGLFAEENEGDGLVSLNSAALTWIEPEPFKLNHFALFGDSEVQRVAAEFVNLYRTFNWPMLFEEVWKADTGYSRIVSVWEREARLNYRSVAFDILLEHNMNMLRSVPEGAIIITNGDNDTYPAWLLQQGGFRDDVLVVNRSLFNRTEYVLFLQKQGLGLSLSEAEIDGVTHEKENGEVITKSDKLIKVLIERGKRQVVLSTTVYAPEKFGFPLTLRGLVYEIGDHGVAVDGKYVDTDATLRLFHEAFTYRKIFSVPFNRISKDIQALFANYAGAFIHTVNALKDQGRFAEALKEIAFARKMLPEFAVPFVSFAEAEIYLETNESEMADSLFEEILEMPDASATLKISIAEQYRRKGMDERAIRVLARLLQDEPGNKEVLELLSRYQEK